MAEETAGGQPPSEPWLDDDAFDEDAFDEDAFDEDAFDEEETGPVIVRRPVRDSAELDITPMIDITFLLLIFFLVASTADVQTSVALPPARHGKGVSERTATIITVAQRGGPGPALVYLGDGTGGTPLPDDPKVQEARIAQAVQEAFDQGKHTVLLKAGRRVLHHDVSRVAAAAALVEGIKFDVAVFEAD